VTDEQRLSSAADITEKSTESFFGPRTPIERQLAQIWSDVLGQERISIYANSLGWGDIPC
jgi:hypothetical protein